MTSKTKLGLSMVVAIALAACPLVAAGGERATCATILRALVGTPEASEIGSASVLVIPGPFVLLGKSPEQDARDVLQLMSQLKETYRLGGVNLAGTSGAWLAVGEGSDVPVPVADIGARVHASGLRRDEGGLQRQAHKAGRGAVGDHGRRHPRRAWPYRHP